MFSVLTSKIFGGTTVILVVALLGTVFSYRGKVNRLEGDIAKQNTDIINLNLDLRTARSNAATLQSGLDTCNASVQTYRDTVAQVERSGLAVLAEVKKGNARVARSIADIDNMAGQTCDDALAILKAGVN